ncbi:hypothetical protein [Terricaulis sp.]|uniref:hypothetical protein n=1 Tax=Terricaulis sp. TaxID=2768686 RepID=UPI0037853152
MTLEQWSSASQIIAALGVIASLVYLALQVRQSEISQRALVLQARTDRGITLSLCFSEPYMGDLLAKIIRGDSDLDAAQQAALLGYVRSLALNVLDAQAQNTTGLLNDAGFERALAGARWFFSLPHARATWRLLHVQFTPADVASLDRLLVEPVPLAAPVDQVAEGNAIRAELLAAGRSPA